jgi:hypothetical protein
MKSIIKEILTEIVEEGQQTQSCKADQPTNEFLRGFSLWRTGMCNEDTFKTPKKINELVLNLLNWITERQLLKRSILKD